MTPAADTSVRVAWADDSSAIAGIQIAAWRDEYAAVLPPETLAGLDQDTIAAQWHASLARPTDARNRVLVALERNRVTGFVVTGPATDPDCDPIAVGTLTDLTVPPAERGHGHASRLLQAAADTLVADRFTLAVAWLNAVDDPRREFLRSAGWETDGAHRELDLDGDGAVTVKQVRLHTALA